MANNPQRLLLRNLKKTFGSLRGLAEKPTPHQLHYRKLLREAGNKTPRHDPNKYKHLFKSQLEGAALVSFFKTELRFHPVRKWRLDWSFVCPCGYKLGIDLQGGIWGNAVTCNVCGAKVKRRLKDGRLIPVREGGHHNTAKSMMEDMDKSNAAQRQGFNFLTFGPQHILKGTALALVKEMVAIHLHHAGIF